MARQLCQRLSETARLVGCSWSAFVRTYATNSGQRRDKPQIGDRLVIQKSVGLIPSTVLSVILALGLVVFPSLWVQKSQELTFLNCYSGHVLCLNLRSTRGNIMKQSRRYTDTNIQCQFSVFFLN